MSSTQAANESTRQAAARPVKEIRLGRIRAAIWGNETANGTRFNVTASRLYKDGDTWKDSSSFGRDDLPLVMKALDHCHSWIFAEQGNTSSVDASDDSGTGDKPF